MERNIQKNGLVNLFILLAVGLAAFAVARYANSLAGTVAAGFLGLGGLVALVSWFQMRLEAREQIEKLEFDEVTKGGAGSASLFETREAENFPARRSREQFERFFVPGFTMLLFLLEAAGAWLLWRWLQKLPAPVLQQMLVAMAITGLLALVLFLIGKYAGNLARLENQRLLRPGASAMLLGAYLLALVLGGIVAAEAGFPRVDLYFAYGLCALLGLLAAENFITLLLEIYRPRVKGRQARILYESRLVGLMSHPEDVFTTAAHALDYQFGFKVSETWFYQFLRKSLALLVLMQLGILLLSSCFVFVNAGQQVLLDRFGVPVSGREVLGPGLHPKLPWPIDQTYRYTNEAIQSFNIGFEHDEKDEKEKTVLWTVAHYKDEFHLLVASRDPVDATTNAASGKKNPPVSLLSVGIPVQFSITNLAQWAYNYSDAAALLERTGTREVVRYLVSVDLNEMMSSGRFPAGEELRRRIQDAANELKLGVKIIFVGLQDVHPPVQVAQSFENVVSARQKRLANLNVAEAHKIRTNAQAAAVSYTIRRQAEADRWRVEADALARVSLFTNQIAAYQASPEVYSQRAYLQALARGAGNARKYILATTNTQDVLLLNLEDKVYQPLLDVPLPAAKGK